MGDILEDFVKEQSRFLPGFYSAMKNKSRVQKVAILKIAVIIFSKGEITDIEQNFIAQLAYNLFGSISNDIIHDINNMSEGQCLEIVTVLRRPVFHNIHRIELGIEEYFSKFTYLLSILNINFLVERGLVAEAITKKTRR